MTHPDPSSPDDEDRVFDVLAGRSTGHPGAEALRQALLSEQQTVQEAERARPQPLSAAEQAEMERIRRRLMQAGALPAEPSTARPAHTPLRMGKDQGPLAALGVALRRFFFGAGWPRQAAMFASLAAIATVVGLQWSHLRGEDDDGGAMRGGSVPELRVAEPLPTAQALQAKLQAAGAEVMLVQINDRTWLLSAEVPRKDAEAAIRQVLTNAGVGVPGPPPFEVRVTGER